MRVSRGTLWALCGCATLVAGCGQPPPATFALNNKTEELIAPARNAVAQALSDNFGNPNQLIAWKKLPLDYGAPQSGADQPHRQSEGWRLKEGRNLYMQHCQHCHGVSGDGAGPTARFLNPRPRDYRQGVFKFKSTKGALRPTKSDLVSILEYGIPGTYMPSFVLLGQEKLGLIADYVRWLSMRGELEIQLYNEFAGAGALENDVRRAVADSEGKLKRADAEAEVMKSIDEELATTIDERAGDVVGGWVTAEEPESIVRPTVKRTPPTTESIERGRLLYLSQIPGKKTECPDCHGRTGRGDGPNTEQFWPIPGTTPERKYEVVGLHDAWRQPQQPRNLTRGVYRGGRRPIDIYRRIYSGINGTQMPAFGGSVLKEEEVWDLVNYVLSIPFDGQESPAPGNGADGDERVARSDP